jgi:ribosomal-protein-alanine N-acetyltransferase
VRRSNEEARGLYERFGFGVAGVRKGYYTNPPEDALVLWSENLPHV